MNNFLPTNLKIWKRWATFWKNTKKVTHKFNLNINSNTDFIQEEIENPNKHTSLTEIDRSCFACKWLMSCTAVAPYDVNKHESI